MNKNHLITLVAVVIIVGVGAFYAGTAYGKGGASMRGLTNGQFTAGGAGGFAGRTGMRGAGDGFTAGEIVSAGNGSVSIRMQNGSSTEIVLVGASTQILKSVAGSASDLTVGATVIVTGTSNSDGSLTAQSIQIRPAGISSGNNRPPQSSQ